MNMKEDQPSGSNPEWENNREQNIAIAKRIEALLLQHFPPSSAEAILGIDENILYHTDQEKVIVLTVIQDRERMREEKTTMDILPSSFTFPVYAIEANTVFGWNIYTTMTVTSPYGETENHIIGNAGLWYAVENLYCFDSSGQGAKIEDITEMGRIEDIDDLTNDDAERVCNTLKRVDFVPSNEDSRVVPLTADDYAKINKMFQDIDTGVYKYNA